MRRAWWVAVLCVLAGSAVATAQTPGILYSFPGTPASIANWVLNNANSLGMQTTFGSGTMSGATGDLVVTENGNGSGVGASGGLVGGPWFLAEPYNYPMESGLYQPAGSPFEKGNLDVTGLQYIEADIKNNSATPVNVDFQLLVTETENVVVPNTMSFAVGSGLTTLRFPLSLLTPRQQTNVKSIVIAPQSHASAGNLTWTIPQIRSVGTPLAFRDIVTNNAGTPDEGIDGAFPLNTSDMTAIAGNTGSVSQLGFSRNAAGSGSLQWTDLGNHGDLNNVSGATIGWGDGSGWRSTSQANRTGSPTSGNAYNERIADFSNYNRMTVRISAQDLVNPAGTIGIQGLFAASDPNGDSAAGPNPATMLTSQSLPTDGQYHDLVYDLSSVTFLKNVWQWGLDVDAHLNDITFNIDNIRLWNSAVPQGVPGDYNGNGVVDMADYVLWRNGGALQNEGATPGSNTPEDYAFWRAHFGATSGSGSAVASVAVPEPRLPLLFLIAAVRVLVGRRRDQLALFRR